MSNENEQTTNRPKVCWGVAFERAIAHEAVAAMLDVAMHCGANNFTRISLGYSRIDTARNLFVEAFLKHTDDPNDVLVMLDADHVHPAWIVERLATAPPHVGVVGALAYRRGGNFDPCFYMADEDGGLHAPMTWEEGRVYECAAVGSAAIAIKRWVFKALDESGWKWPYFRYEYPMVRGEAFPSEDMVFARACMRAGIKHHCDTGTVTPHIRTETVEGREWAEFVKEHKNGGILL